MLCNMKQDVKVMKTNDENVKFCNKNVNAVEKKYITAQKYLLTKGNLAFYWVIVLITMITPIYSHVKDKNDMLTLVVKI